MDDLTPTQRQKTVPPYSTQNTELFQQHQEPHYIHVNQVDGRTFSFQQPSTNKIQDFCTQFLNLYALDKIGKRITDPNVTLLNSTQKQIVQTIVQTNANKTDQKSKFLTQRAQRFLKILWKAEKYNDAFLQRKKIEKQIPNYASPIHNFRKHKLTLNNSFGTISNKSSKTGRSASQKSVNILSPKQKKQSFNRPASKTKQLRSISSKGKSFSQDHKFQRIRLTPKPKNFRPNAEKEKSFEIDLRQNVSLVERTISRTKQFDNMLKILKKKDH